MKYFCQWQQQRTAMCGNCLDNATILEATTRGENREKKKKSMSCYQQERTSWPWSPGRINTGWNSRIAKSQLEFQEKVLLSICKPLSWERVNHRMTKIHPHNEAVEVTDEILGYSRKILTAQTEMHSPTHAWGNLLKPERRQRKSH